MPSVVTQIWGNFASLQHHGLIERACNLSCPDALTSPNKPVMRGKKSSLSLGICLSRNIKMILFHFMSFSKCRSFNATRVLICGTERRGDDTDVNPRTVVEEQQHSEAQSGRGQQNQADVAGDHEVAHHQGHLVLVPTVLVQRRRRGIVAPAHAPLQRPPPLQGRGEDGPRRAARGAQRPVGKNDGGGGQRTGMKWKKRASGDMWWSAFSAAVPAACCGEGPTSVSIKSQRQTFTGFQATHFQRE